MHRLRRSIVKRIGGFATLCAILLLSIAPLASQWFSHQRADLTLASLCASGAKQTSRQAETHHASHDVLGHFDACGYCNLVTHAPVPLVIAFDEHRAAHTREAFDDAVIAGPTYGTSRTYTQSRAPPAFA